MKINLGAGKDWEKANGYDGVDIVDFGQKYVFDITKTPWPIEKDSVSEIRSHNVFEHIEVSKIIDVMNECHRLLKKGGILDLIVPRYPSSSSIADPTHKSMWQFEQIKGKGVNINIFWNNKPPKVFWSRRMFEYFAGGKPRNADYGIRKWAIENDGEGNYTTKLTEKSIHIKLVK